MILRSWKSGWKWRWERMYRQWNFFTGLLRTNSEVKRSIRTVTGFETLLSWSRHSLVRLLGVSTRAPGTLSRTITTMKLQRPSCFPYRRKKSILIGKGNTTFIAILKTGRDLDRMTSIFVIRLIRKRTPKVCFRICITCTQMHTLTESMQILKKRLLCF